MVNVKIVNGNYDVKVGLQKTLKNIMWTYGVPALLFFLGSYAEWVPQEYVVVLAPLIGGISYAIKNYSENK
jgi:hypothetical protein